MAEAQSNENNFGLQINKVLFSECSISCILKLTIKRMGYTQLRQPENKKFKLLSLK